jgi:hypothetical protein
VITSLTLRKLSLAPIAALALAAGLLSAAPANAVVVPTAAFVVTSPAAGEAVASRTVQFAGTGTPAAAVGVTSLDGASLFGVPAIVDATGAWSLTVDFAANAETTQSLLVSQVIDLTTPPTSVPVTFTLPSAPVEPVAAIVLTDPGSLEVLTSRTVTFAGSAPAGTEISITNTDGSATVTTVADDLNAFVTDLVFSDEASLVQDVTVSGTLDGVALTAVTVLLILPPLPLAVPVITAPAAGSTVTGATVVVSGTGEAGATIALIYAPTADLASGADIATLDSAALAGVGGDIVVTAEGTWSTTLTLTLAPNAYSFFAGQSLLIGAEGNVAASDRSERRDFTLVAQAVAPAAPTVPVNTPAVPVRVPAAPASGVRELAATGVETTGLAGGISALLLALGAAAIVAARRRQLTSEL